MRIDLQMVEPGAVVSGHPGKSQLEKLTQHGSDHSRSLLWDPHAHNFLWPSGIPGTTIPGTEPKSQTIPGTGGQSRVSFEIQSQSRVSQSRVSLETKNTISLEKFTKSIQKLIFHLTNGNRNQRGAAPAAG